MSQAIDDREISCDLPRIPPLGLRSDLKTSTALVQAARLFSKVSRELSISRIVQDLPEVTIKLVSELHEAVQNIHTLASSDRDRPRPLSFNQSVQQEYLPLQFSYWGLLCQLHGTFLYPWVTDALQRAIEGKMKNNQDPNDKRRWSSRHVALGDQIETSSSILAEACRSLVLTTKSIILDATSSKT